MPLICGTSTTADLLSAVNANTDALTLEVFQEPTDGLTRASTRTTGGGEVYEVRRVSDSSLAAIYSDKEGTTEITQDGTSNVSSNGGRVEFYIAGGDYYLSAGGDATNFRVDNVAGDYYTLAEARALNPIKGRRVKLKDYGNALYEFVSESDTGGFYLTHPLADTKLSLVGNALYNSAKWFGLKGDGTANGELFINDVITFCNQSGGLWFPAGTWRGKFSVSAYCPIKGSGVHSTFLTPTDVNSYCLRLFGNAGGNSDLDFKVTDLTIKNDVAAKTGTGLQFGELGNSAGCSNVTINKVNVEGFQYNLRIERLIIGSIDDMNITGGTYGIFIDSEKNVTTATFRGVRCRQNTYGGRIEAGELLKFTGCNFESNIQRNLWMRTSVSRGPTRVEFDHSWFEAPTIGAPSANGGECIYLDQQTDKPFDLLFSNCVISSPDGLYDVRTGARARGVVFDRCAFSGGVGGFTSAKFDFVGGSNGVDVLLKNCSTLQDLPAPDLYENFPPLERPSGGVFGFKYEFTQTGGQRHDNFRTLRIDSNVSDLQVSGVEKLIVDTSAGNVTIDSFYGGTDSSVLRIIKPSSANSIIISHNGAGGTGSQKVFTPSSADINLTGRNGVTLACDKIDGATGGTWYEA